MFQLNNVLCIDVTVGNLSMEKLSQQNISMSVSLLVSLLKKNWLNVSPLELSFPEFSIHFLHQHVRIINNPTPSWDV
jgi:hypothetical protein